MLFLPCILIRISTSMLAGWLSLHRCTVAKPRPQNLGEIVAIARGESEGGVTSGDSVSNVRFVRRLLFGRSCGCNHVVLKKSDKLSQCYPAFSSD